MRTAPWGAKSGGGGLGVGEGFGGRKRRRRRSYGGEMAGSHSLELYGFHGRELENTLLLLLISTTQSNRFIHYGYFSSL